MHSRATSPGSSASSATDRRVHAWDLFNEPDNTNGSSYGRLEPAGKPELAMALLEKTFAWARAVAPSQPLTAGVWQGNLSDPERLSPINQYMLAHSDVISFHNYRPLAEMKKDVEALKQLPPADPVHRVHGPAGGQHVRPDPALPEGGACRGV